MASPTSQVGSNDLFGFRLTALSLLILVFQHANLVIFYAFGASIKDLTKVLCTLLLDELHVEDSSPVRHGLDFFTAGNGLFPTNIFDAYGGFANPPDFNNHNNHHINNQSIDSVSASADSFRNPSQANDNSSASSSSLVSPLPSFPATFGQQVATSSLPSPFPAALPPFVQPYPDFFDAAPSATPNLPNSDTFEDLGSADPSQMPDRNQGSHHQPGDGFINDTTFAGANACPFAPLRQNYSRINPNSFNPPHHHYHPHNYNPNSSLSSRLPTSSLPQPTFPSLARSYCQHREPNSDDYLSALIHGEFSSPSLPPLNSSPFPPLSSHAQSTHLPPLQPLEINANMPRLPSVPTAASRRGRRPSRPSVVDLSSPKTERRSATPSGIDSNAPRAPSNRKRSHAAATTTSSQGSPHQRHGSSATRPNPIKPLKSSRRTSAQDEALSFDTSSISGNDEEEVLDLTGNDMPEELLKPKVDNRVKLTKFQCVICMDDVSNLTVTHCGKFLSSPFPHSHRHIIRAVPLLTCLAQVIYSALNAYTRLSISIARRSPALFVGPRWRRRPNQGGSKARTLTITSSCNS